jgi:hypothetical protein
MSNPMDDQKLNAARDGKALIMVLGAARSGTTMLDLMLGNSDDVFSCGEVWCMFRPHRIHHFGPGCSCGDPECSVWGELSKCHEREFHAEALKQPDVKFVIDSSKDLRWLIDSHEWARQSGTNVLNVITWKDPISLAYSHWKRGKPVDYYRLAFVRYYGRFLNLGLPFVSLSYNRIIADPGAALRDLCSHLGMDYQEGREEFWQKRHHQLLGSAGTAKQVSQGASKVYAQSEYPEAFLKEFGRLGDENGADAEINALIHQLEAHELGRSGASLAGSVALGPTLKPAWYYYHGLKAIYRKWFPSSGPVPIDIG